MGLGIEENGIHFVDHFFDFPIFLNCIDANECVANRHYDDHHRRDTLLTVNHNDFIFIFKTSEASNVVLLFFE